MEKPKAHNIMALLSGIRNSSHTVLFLQNSSARYLLKPNLFFLQDATISKQHMLLIQRMNKRVVFFHAKKSSVLRVCNVLSAFTILFCF